MIFKDVSTSESILDLQYFRSEVIDCIEKIEKKESLFAALFKNEIRKIDARIDYLEHKHIWDMI